ncbi:MAG: protein kinase [Planctomycetes bacterium]|nr:protein kinase [Planctomycetota bacterium]
MDIEHLRHVVADVGEEEFADLCLRLGFATPAQVDAAREERGSGGCRLRLDQILVRRGVLTGAQIAELLRLRGGTSPGDGDIEHPSDSDGSAGAQGVPDRIGNYRIERELGRGGMAVVYRAQDLDSGRTVALKVMLARRRGGNTLARFRREAKAVARLRHPNIVRVLGRGVDRGRPFLALEYVEGRTLDQELAGEGLSREEGLRIVREIALGVGHAHRNGVIHRDLKPRNILIDSTGRPRIVDFGLAKLDDSGTRLTSTDAWIGTPLYMAPEQVLRDHRGVGPWTDIYAMGAILFETLYGVPPFRADSSQALFAKILRKAPEPPSTGGADVDPALAAVALRALEKDPERRQTSALEFARDLGRALGETEFEAETSDPEGPPRSIRSRSRAAALAGGLIALLVVGLAIARGWFAGDESVADPIVPASGAKKETRLAPRWVELARETGVAMRRLEDAYHGASSSSEEIEDALASIEEASRGEGPAADQAGAWRDLACFYAGRTGPPAPRGTGGVELLLAARARVALYLERAVPPLGGGTDGEPPALSWSEPGAVASIREEAHELLVRSVSAGEGWPGGAGAWYAAARELADRTANPPSEEGRQAEEGPQVGSLLEAEVRAMRALSNYLAGRHAAASADWVPGADRGWAFAFRNLAAAEIAIERERGSGSGDASSGYSRAIDRLDRAIASRPQDASAFLFRAYAHQALGRAAEAGGRSSAGSYRKSIADSTEAVRLEPGGMGARAIRSAACRLLADREAARGDDPSGALGQAADDLRTLADAAPEDADVRIALGDVLDRLGQPEEAVAAYEAALRLRPGDPAIEARLEEVRKRVGR